MKEFMTEQDRNDLKWAMKYALLEQCNKSNKCEKNRKKFIKEEATYEQLLNLCFVKDTKNTYMESSALEMVAAARMIKMEQTAIKSGKKIIFEGDQVPVDSRAVIGGITNKAQGLVGKTKEMGQTVLAKINQMAAQVKQYYNNPENAKTLKVGGIILTGVATAVAAAWIFKRFFSAAAKACAGAPDRNACIKEYKNRAVTATIQRLEAEKAACAQSPNPQECNAKLDAEIQKWRGKLV
jgi:hypothetical protein